MLNGAIWAPLVFLFMLRALRGRRRVSSAALSGMFLGISWLSGHHQAPVFLTVTTASVWVAALVRRRPGFRRRTLGLAATCGVFFILTGALQIFPALEYGRLSRRWVGLESAIPWNQPVPYSIHQQFSLDPLSILGMIFPGIHRHSDPFVGVVVLTLAALALFARPKHPAVRLFAGVSLAGVLLALGHNSVFHGVLYAVLPGVEKARSPSMAIFIFNFGIAALTAFGIDVLQLSRRPSWIPRMVSVLGLLGAAVYAVLLSAQTLQKPVADDRIAITALVALLLSGVLYARYRRQLSGAAATLCCFGLMLLELGNVTGFGYPNRFEKERNNFSPMLARNADIAQFIKEQPWPSRVDIDDQEIAFNYGDWHGIDVYGGYFASLPDNLWKLEMHTPRVQNLLGVTYAVRRQPSRDGQIEVFRGASGLKVYLNPDALPRVWTVHEIRPADTQDEVTRVLQESTFDFRRTALLPKAVVPRLESCAGSDQVRLLRRDTNRVEIEADMRCRGMVVLSEAHFPGWRATVDGKPASILPAYSAIRGVVVEPGKHRIDMRYRPRSVLAGAFLTALGILGACALKAADSRQLTAATRPVRGRLPET